MAHLKYDWLYFKNTRGLKFILWDMKLYNLSLNKHSNAQSNSDNNYIY
jgi:hypothetical protein